MVGLPLKRHEYSLLKLSRPIKTEPSQADLLRLHIHR
jgi:hypothetical protein